MKTNAKNIVVSNENRRGYIKRCYLRSIISIVF